MSNRRRSKNPINAFLPLMGLLMLIALGAIAFVLSEPLHELLLENVADFPADNSGRLTVGGFIFTLLLMLSAMLYALFAPKPEKTVNEAQLMKERKEAAEEKRRRRQRMQENNRLAARERERREREGR
ncbi:MAG: hypothetical protein OHK0046_43180 [Anaerolineae bacterium]